MAIPKTVCVFCGSNPGHNPAYAEAAVALGECLAERGIELVYGGASLGLMGTIADTVLAAGGTVTGVFPKPLEDKEIAHTGLTKLHVVGSMHERKALMADLSDGFIAMPGGFGTAEELCEIITWGQLEFHRKPIGLLNVDGYYDSFLAFIDKGVKDGFIGEAHRCLVIDSTSPMEILEAFVRHRAATTGALPNGAGR